jgi:hypothetical protein
MSKKTIVFMKSIVGMYIYKTLGFTLVLRGLHAKQRELAFSVGRASLVLGFVSWNGRTAAGGQEIFHKYSREVQKRLLNQKPGRRRFATGETAKNNGRGSPFLEPSIAEGFVFTNKSRIVSSFGDYATAANLAGIPNPFHCAMDSRSSASNSFN